MKLVQIVFSPTGGTQKAADIITDEWKGAVVRVDLCDAKTDYSKITIGAEDIALVAVPSYGGRVPELAAKRLTMVYMATAHMRIPSLSCRILWRIVVSVLPLESPQ